MRFVGALLITYFISRGLRYFGLKYPSVAKLIAGHIASLALACLLVIAIRYPAGAYDTSQLWVYVIAQGVWLAVDSFRARAAIWKAPVTKATESSSRERAENTR